MSHILTATSNTVHKQTNKQTRHTTNFRLVGVIAHTLWLAGWLTLWLPSVLGSEL
jgi:hypothetical protein